MNNGRTSGPGAQCKFQVNEEQGGGNPVGDAVEEPTGEQSKKRRVGQQRAKWHLRCLRPRRCRAIRNAEQQSWNDRGANENC